jgi:putative aldouronate transport system substrate-binding protein
LFRLSKKTGVNLYLMVLAGNENKKLNTMIASSKLSDFITLDVNDENVKKLIDGGLVLPIKNWQNSIKNIRDQQITL